MDSSITYIHTEPPSFRARVLRASLAFIGLKNVIEQKIKKGKYAQEAASLPGSLQDNFDIQEKAKQGRSVWTLKPKQNVTEKVILYIHGGAYVFNLSKFHWDLIEVLLKKTNATIVVPDYPLAPASTYADVYDFMEDLYLELLAEIPPQDIILMGDSAGAGFALGFAKALRDNNKAQPSQIIMLSPWLDISMSNPAMIKYLTKDNILGIEGLQLAGEAYAGTLDRRDSRVSPIYGSFSGLGKISVFTGTHDLLYADIKKLRLSMEEANIPINYFEYPGMFHVWILLTSLSESRHATDQVALLIGNDVPA